MILAEAGGSGAKWDVFRPCRLLQKLQRTARVIIGSNRGRYLLRPAKSLMKRDKGDSDKNRRKLGEFEEKEKMGRKADGYSFNFKNWTEVLRDIYGMHLYLWAAAEQ